MARQEPMGAIRVPSWAYTAVTVGSLLLGAEAVIRGTSAFTDIGDSDLTNFFFKSADHILHGDPWHMYAVRGSGATSSYPNYNPPLSIFLLALFRALGHALHRDMNLGAQITVVALPFMAFVPLLGYMVLRALRTFYPEMPETQRLLAYMLVTLSPLTWQAFGTWYHIEQPMMLCLLVGSMLALQQRRAGLAGALAGLAVMTRTTAMFPLIALGVLFVLGRDWRALAKWAGALVAVVAVVMAPFALADWKDVSYSFLTWRGGAPVGGNSIWALPAAIHPLNGLARRLDAPSVVVFVAVVGYLAWRRLHVSPYGRDAWAVLTIAALAVPMLSKTNWPYYYLEPFVLLIVWEFSSMHDRLAGVWRWPVLTFGFLLVAGTLSQYIGLRSVGTFDRLAVGVLEFAAMLAFAVAGWLRLQAAKPGAAGSAGADWYPQGGQTARSGMAQMAQMAPPSTPFAGAGPQQYAPPMGGAWGAAQPAEPSLPTPNGARGGGQNGGVSWMWTPNGDREGSGHSADEKPSWMWSPERDHQSGKQPQAGQAQAPRGSLPAQWPDLDAQWPPFPPAPRNNG